MNGAGADDFEEIDGLPGGIDAEPVEEVDGIAVLTQAGPVERRPGLLPVPVQAAAVAVGGFLAGVLTIVLFRRRRAVGALARRGRTGRWARRRGEDRGHVVASRSFLVDVHLLGGRE